MTRAGEYDAAAPTERTPDGSRAPQAPVLSRLLRRWWVVAVVTALALLIGFLYLTLAKTLYTAHAVLVMDQDARSLPPDEYLQSQQQLILSPQAKHGSLRVRADKGEGTLTLSLDADTPALASSRLSGIIDDYMKSAQQQQASESAGWKQFALERDRLASERAAKERALLEFQDRENVTGTQADQAGAARLEQLRKALTAAQVEAAGAKAAADAADELLKDPQQLTNLIAGTRSSGIYAAIDQQKSQIEKELDALAPQLQKQKETLLPQHPVLAQTQRKMDELRQRLYGLDAQYAQSYRNYAEQQKLVTQKKVQEISELIAAQEQEAQAYLAKLARHEALEAELKSADAALAAAERKLADAAAIGGDALLPMKVVQPPRASDRPSHPRAANVMMLAGVCGVVVGALVAVATGARAR